MSVIIGLLILVVLLLGWIGIALMGLSKNKNVTPNVSFEANASLREMVERLRDQDRVERDKELAAYAEQKRKHQAILNPMAGISEDGRIHQTNPKAEKILIPENLSEEDKQNLKDFFNL